MFIPTGNGRLEIRCHGNRPDISLDLFNLRNLRDIWNHLIGAPHLRARGNADRTGRGCDDSGPDRISYHRSPNYGLTRGALKLADVTSLL